MGIRWRNVAWAWAALAGGGSMNANAVVLETPSFVVTLTMPCADAEACNKVTYHGMNKKTGAALELQGAVLRESCAKSAQPCPIRVYQFTNGSVRYVVHPAGLLQVFVKQHEIIAEQGQWHD